MRLPHTPVGFTIQPERRFLELTEDVAARADFLEVTPEATWRFEPGGRIAPNGFFARFLEFGRRRRLPFVAHGVGWSPGGSEAASSARRRLWLAGIAATHDEFRFQWLTDHFGATTLAGQDLILPLALPMTGEVAARVRRNLALLQSVVPDVGVENSAFYFQLGRPLDEPDFLARSIAGPHMHLLLDLHNLHTMAVNFGFDPADYLAHLPLERVIEIHVSGGSESEPAWLSDGATMRLDSHDRAVPEEVFALLEAVRPRCANLRGVTLERMEGTVEPKDVPALADGLRRLREVCA